MSSATQLEKTLEAWPRERIRSLLDQATEADVDNAINRAANDRELTLHDFAALLSAPARSRLEPMAREAHRLTRWHFGRTVTLYAPIYLSNVCAADCLYCGFARGSGSRDKRITLDEDQIRIECEALRSEGFQTVLLVTGEAPKIASAEYVARAVEIAHEYFASVSMEVYSMTDEEYALICSRGLEGVTLYMETYDRERYKEVHRAGRKQDYAARLASLDLAGAAGVRKLNLGALLGLFDWRLDGFWLGIHGRHLQKACWRSSVAVSFPRLRNVPPRFPIPVSVGDPELVQLMLALRLFLPEAGFTMSTRERAELRDSLIPLGVTQLSAGSSTRPGGYSCPQEGAVALEQFSVEDLRRPPEVVQAVMSAGYDPVWKDFDRAFTHI